jgi:hypothetical protein
MGPHPRTTVREFRKNLATALGSGKVIAVGTPDEIRAFLIAVPKHNQSDQKEKRKALRAALKAIQAAIQAEMS